MMTLVKDPITLAVLLSIAVYSTLLIRWGLRYPKLLWRIFIWFIGFGIAASILLAPRSQNLDQELRFLGPSATSGEPWQLALRILALGAFGLGAVCLLVGLRYRQPLFTNGSGLWLGVAAFAGGSLIASFLGTVPSMNYGLFFVPVVFSALYFLPSADHGWLMAQLKGVLLLFIFGSIIACLLAPEWAFELNYDGSSISGVDVRLYGLSTHANILGPIAALYLILEWLHPSKRLYRFINCSAAAFVLVSAQSKTALVIAGAMVLLKIVMWAWYSRSRSIGRSLTALSSGAALAVLLVLLPTVISELERPEYHNYVMLTGRTSIWDITVETWRWSPVFGYGPTIWDLDFRLQHGHGYIWAGNAHNQFVQSLGEAGLVGIAGFIAYMIVLLLYAFRYARQTQGASLAIFLFLFLRTVTEASLRNYIIDQAFLVHLVCFLAMLSLARQYPYTRPVDASHEEYLSTSRLIFVAKGTE
jgi:exopolysaccharide production protein ExoQ